MNQSLLFRWREAVVGENGPPDSVTRLVLLVLSLNMNKEGGSCFPSVEALARRCSLNERTVRRHLDRAEDLGWIRRSRRRQKGRGWKLTNYTATFPGKACLVRPLAAVGVGAGGAGREPGARGSDGSGGPGGEPGAGAGEDRALAAGGPGGESVLRALGTGGPGGRPAYLVREGVRGELDKEAVSTAAAAVEEFCERTHAAWKLPEGVETFAAELVAKYPDIDVSAELQRGALYYVENAVVPSSPGVAMRRWLDRAKPPADSGSASAALSRWAEAARLGANASEADVRAIWAWREANPAAAAELREAVSKYANQDDEHRGILRGLGGTDAAAQWRIVRERGEILRRMGCRAQAGAVTAFEEGPRAPVSDVATPGSPAVRRSRKCDSCGGGLHPDDPDGGPCHSCRTFRAMFGNTRSSARERNAPSVP